VVEAAVRTSVRRLIWRFPKPARFLDIRCSSADRHSTYTGRVVVVFRARAYGSAIAAAVVAAVCVTVRVSCTLVPVVVVWADHPVYLLVPRSGGGPRTWLDAVVVYACDVFFALVQLSFVLVAVQLVQVPGRC